MRSLGQPLFNNLPGWVSVDHRLPHLLEGRLAMRIDWWGRTPDRLRDAFQFVHPKVQAFQGPMQGFLESESSFFRGLIQGVRR